MVACFIAPVQHGVLLFVPSRVKGPFAKYRTFARLLTQRGWNAYKANELNADKINNLTQQLNYEAVIQYSGLKDNDLLYYSYTNQLRNALHSSSDRWFLPAQAYSTFFACPGMWHKEVRWQAWPLHQVTCRECLHIYFVAVLRRLSPCVVSSVDAGGHVREAACK